MASQRTKFAVGLFVACGFGIAILAIIWLGMSHFLEKGKSYVTFFNESVQGLDKDSQVKFRGVAVGRVKSIGVAPDSKLIQVVFSLETGQSISKDIVAQLKSVGITGIMYVELDLRKKDEPDRSPTVNFPAIHEIVPSRPSEISQIMQGIADVLTQVRSVDLPGISTKVKSTLDNINQTISDANVKGISKNIESSFEQVNRILDERRWDKIMVSVEEASGSLNTVIKKAGRSLNRVENTFARVEGIITEKENAIKSAIEDFRLAMKNANIFLEKGSSLVSGTDESLSQLKRHLLVVAQNMEMASENLNRLSELLVDQPAQMIFGEPPVPRNVEGDGYER